MRSWNLSNLQLGLLYGAAVVLGGDLVVIFWHFSQGRAIWGPIMGAIAMLLTSLNVLRAAKRRE
jgi:hypothetical protein